MFFNHRIRQVRQFDQAPSTGVAEVIKELSRGLTN